MSPLHGAPATEVTSLSGRMWDTFCFLHVETVRRSPAAGWVSIVSGKERPLGPLLGLVLRDLPGGGLGRGRLTVSARSRVLAGSPGCRRLVPGPGSSLVTGRGSSSGQQAVLLTGYPGSWRREGSDNLHGASDRPQAHLRFLGHPSAVGRHDRWLAVPSLSTVTRSLGRRPIKQSCSLINAPLSTCDRETQCSLGSDHELGVSRKQCPRPVHPHASRAEVRLRPADTGCDLGVSVGPAPKLKAGPQVAGLLTLRNSSHSGDSPDGVSVGVVGDTAASWPR